MLALPRSKIQRNPKAMSSGIEKRAVVILCTAPAEGDHATRLARDLVGARLAACVNVISGVRSIYRWEGEVQEDAEVQLVIKTDAHLVDAVTAWLEAHHPYDVPEVLALAVSQGSAAYLAWSAAQTTSAD